MNNNRVLIIIALMCILAVPAAAQKTAPKSKPVAVKQHKPHGFRKIFLVPGRYALAGLLRLVLNSSGEPY